MRGRSNTTLNPTDGITDTEARIIIESIDRRVVCPVWAMPVSNRKFVRVVHLHPGCRGPLAL